eukprot:8853328-Pyramimonas_sp.AAC.1
MFVLLGVRGGWRGSDKGRMYVGCGVCTGSDVRAIQLSCLEFNNWCIQLWRARALGFWALHLPSDAVDAHVGRVGLHGDAAQAAEHRAGGGYRGVHGDEW